MIHFGSPQGGPTPEPVAKPKPLVHFGSPTPEASDD